MDLDFLTGGFKTCDSLSEQGADLGVICHQRSMLAEQCNPLPALSPVFPLQPVLLHILMHPRQPISSELSLMPQHPGLM